MKRKPRPKSIDQIIAEHNEAMIVIGDHMGSEWAKDLWANGNGTPQGLIRAVDARLSKIEEDVRILKDKSTRPPGVSDG